MTRAAVLARLAGISIAALRSSVSIERLHGERYLELRARGVPILFALWHGRMFLPIQVHRHQGIVTMASQSKDGEIIGLWLERNGYAVVRGSTTRGGSEALRQMVRAVRGGRHAALTVDGPLGPPRLAQPGVIQLARLTGAWILPITFASARGKVFDSWDRFLLPRPFSRNVVAYGEAFPIPDAMSEAAARDRIGEAIDRATSEAEAAAMGA